MVNQSTFVATDRGIDTRFDFMTLNLIIFQLQKYKNAKKTIEKPIDLQR